MNKITLKIPDLQSPISIEAMKARTAIIYTRLIYLYTTKFMSDWGAEKLRNHIFEYKKEPILKLLTKNIWRPMWRNYSDINLQRNTIFKIFETQYTTEIPKILSKLRLENFALAMDLLEFFLIWAPRSITFPFKTFPVVSHIFITRSLVQLVASTVSALHRLQVVWIQFPTSTSCLVHPLARCLSDI